MHRGSVHWRSNKIIWYSTLRRELCIYILQQTAQCQGIVRPLKYSQVWVWFTSGMTLSQMVVAYEKGKPQHLDLPSNQKGPSPTPASRQATELDIMLGKRMWELGFSVPFSTEWREKIDSSSFKILHLGTGFDDLCKLVFSKTIVW